MRHRASVAQAMERKDFGAALFHLNQLIVVLPPNLQKYCLPIFNEASVKISQAASLRDDLNGMGSVAVTYQQVTQKLVIFPSPHYVKIIKKIPEGRIVPDPKLTLYERQKRFGWTCTAVLTAAMSKIMAAIIDNGIFDSIGQREAPGVQPAIQPGKQPP